MTFNFIKFSLFFCVFSFFYSCKKNENFLNTPSKTQAGVVLSFDDSTINEWYAADKTLKKYSWKATFCVSKINTLSNSEIDKLVALQSEGHEIAGHSLNHLNAVAFVKEKGIDAYIKQEIDPMLQLMDVLSLNITSFAYPFGFENKELNDALLRKFKIVRGTTHGSEAPSKQYCYYNNSNVVYGFGIDTDYPKFSTGYLLKLLEYAKKNNKILILFGHKPVTNVTGVYQTKMATLALVCNYVKHHNMKFYTLSDLADIN